MVCDTCGRLQGATLGRHVMAARHGDAAVRRRATQSQRENIYLVRTARLDHLSRIAAHDRSSRETRTSTNASLRRLHGRVAKTNGRTTATVYSTYIQWRVYEYK